MRISHGLASFAAAFIVSLAVPALASAATVQVNTTADSLPAPGECSGGSEDCSIRQAIDAAAAGDTVAIPAGHYLLDPKPGPLVVLKDLNIAGAGARSTTIDGGDKIQVFQLGSTQPSAPTVSISGVEITGGNADSQTNGAGGILSYGTLTVTDSTVRGNHAYYTGGGIAALPPTEGGSPTLRLVNTTVSGNSAPQGGGVYGLYATVTAVNTTVTGNTATGKIDAIGQGGGIWIRPFIAPSTLYNTTVAGNTAVNPPERSDQPSGGNLYFDGMTFSRTLRPVLVLTRPVEPPALRLKNSIVSGGVAATDPNCGGQDYASLGHNVVSDGACGSDATMGDVAADPVLKPLADNGGQTDTLALVDGSPAIGAGDPAGCRDDNDALIALDQRTVSRPQGARCDAGAVESAPPAPTTGDPSLVTRTSATIGGDAVNPDVKPGTVHFQWGTSTDYGQTTPDDGLPEAPRTGKARAKVEGTNPPHASADLTGLTAGTTYHYRLVASNPDATRFGEDRTFTTPPDPKPGPSPAPKPGKPHKPNVRVSRLGAQCYRSRFTARVRVHVAKTTKLRMVRVTLDGRVLHRTKRSQFTFVVPGGALKPGYHVLLVRATDRAGNTTMVRRAFSRCAPAPVPSFTG
jgi:hypothetical protein